jgi:hypothetical protein
LIGADEPHGAATADGDVPERRGQVCLADADGSEDQRAAGVVEEP